MLQDAGKERFWVTWEKELRPRRIGRIGNPEDNLMGVNILGVQGKKLMHFLITATH